MGLGLKNIIGKALLLTLLAPLPALAEYQDPGILEDFEFESTPVVRGGQNASDLDIVSSSSVMVDLPVGTCSGTLIAPDLVLTAAHCLQNVTSATIQGVYQGQHFSSPAYSMRAHSGFKMNKLFFGLAGQSTSNDIALIRLKNKMPAVFRPAALPAREIQYSSQKVIIAGYGRTFSKKKSDKYPDSRVLRFGTSNVKTEHFSGEIKLKESGPAYGCPGDSGGSIYTVSGNRLVLIGIHSYGYCDSRMGWGESVGHHLNWIRKTTQELRSEAEL